MSGFANRLAWVSCLSLVVCCSSTSAVEVVYEVVFDATWSATNHPGAYPPNAHFSRPVGATHNSLVSFWEVGGTATLGIERMAESGATGTLRGEFEAAGPDVDSIFLAGGITSPGTTKATFKAGVAHPLVTLVTMVAPSPDWFLGVSGLDLREDGIWSDELTVDLYTYDSGTDSGPDFRSPNADEPSNRPIALLGAPLAGRPPLGTYTLTLQTPNVQQVVWNTAAGDWASAANWNLMVVPTVTVEVQQTALIPSGAVDVNGQVGEVLSVTVDSGATLNLKPSGNLPITRELTNRGSVQLDQAELTVGSYTMPADASDPKTSIADSVLNIRDDLTFGSGRFWVQPRDLSNFNPIQVGGVAKLGGIFGFDSSDFVTAIAAGESFQLLSATDGVVERYRPDL